MLGFMYTDTIPIKKYVSGDDYSGKVYADSTILGAIQDKTKTRQDNNGNLIVTDVLLFTNEDLPLGTLITYDGRDREIIFRDKIRNHLMGGVDHWEYRL